MHGDNPSDYGDTIATHLTKVQEHNNAAVDTVAQLLLDCVRADGTVFTAGAGHSLATVAETFFRAGGLACVWPLHHSALLPMNGAAASTAAERRSGLAAEVLADVEFGPHDVLFVFSTSGVNPYPVELAQMAAANNTSVVGVTSTMASAAAPRRAGSTLAENASVVLDTLVPAGDSAYPPHAPVTAALSSLANVFLWNLLLVRLVDLAGTAGVPLPLWRSSNVPGGDAANADLLARYQKRVPSL
jgi:uncharacterized phosphosugar-binding protein